MSVKENSDSEGTFVRLFDEEWQPAVDELPTAITPAGFPLARQLYHYEQIREYCRDGTTAETFAGDIPGKPWRPLHVQVSRYRPSLKSCNNIRVRTVLF